MLSGNVKKVFTLLALALLLAPFSGASAQEDLSWLQTAKDCESFSEGVVGFHRSLAAKGSVTENDRANLRFILKEACTERFSSCGFSFCADQTTDTSDGPVSPDEPITRRALLKPAIVTDPLAWLDQPLQCEDLVDQIKARYAPLGSYSDLPSMKKEELGKVLDVACSERFSHCRFPSCGSPSKTAKRAVDPKSSRARLSTAAASADAVVADTGASEADVRISARRATIAELYALKTEERRRQIERAIAEEKAKGVAWKVFSIPGEIESRISSDGDDGTERPARKSVSPAVKNANYAMNGDSYADESKTSRRSSSVSASKPVRRNSSNSNRSRQNGEYEEFTRPQAPARSPQRAF